MWPVGAVSRTTNPSWALGDGARERAEDGDLLGAGRAEVLLKQRTSLVVEVAPGGGQHLGDVGGGLGLGVDAADRETASAPSTAWLRRGLPGRSWRGGRA